MAYISKYNIASPAITNVASISSTPTYVAQSVKGYDDNLYMFYDNKVVRVSPTGVVEDDVCSALPTGYHITCASTYGSYLAIGMTDGQRSTVFIWDYVSDTTVADKIDWGDGQLKVLGTIDGKLVGVSDVDLSTNFFLNGLMSIRMWAGGAPSVVKEVNTKVGGGTLLTGGIVKNNKLYFVASLPLNQSTSTTSTFHTGIWCWGRKDVYSNYALSLEYIEDGVTTNVINSFGIQGDYWYISYNSDGSVSKTDDHTSNYTTTSVFESQILNGDSSSTKKKLIGVTVDTEPLPSAGQVVLKYRKDEETSWTTIFTNTTDNSITHSALNIESSGATLPEFRELQLRVESTGGAEITAIKCKYEALDKEIY